jgi:hypothetical protein
VPVQLHGSYSEVRIRRSDFEDLIRDQVGVTMAVLARTLRSAAVEPAELAGVGLIGGSSRIPLVARMISTELGRAVAVATNPQYAVALGAARLAGQTATPRVPRAQKRANSPLSAPAVPPVAAAAGTSPPKAGRPPRTGRRPAQRRQRLPLRLIASGAALLVTTATAVLVVGVAKPTTTLMNTNTNTEAALVLTTSQVKIGDSYSVTASGFAPSEAVRFSWTGPTDGVLDASPTDATGSRRYGPIIEEVPPGLYRIIATGLTSRRTASARLRVLAADG